MLTGEQIFILGLLVAGVIQFLKIVWIGLLKRPKPTTGVMRLVVFVLSLPIGFLFGKVALPVWAGDPMAFAAALVAAAGQVLVVSGLVYDYVLDGLLRWLDSAILQRAGKAPLLAP